MSTYASRRDEYSAAYAERMALGSDAYAFGPCWSSSGVQPGCRYDPMAAILITTSWPPVVLPSSTPRLR